LGNGGKTGKKKRVSRGSEKKRKGQKSFEKFISGQRGRGEGKYPKGKGVGDRVRRLPLQHVGGGD